MFFFCLLVDGRKPVDSGDKWVKIQKTTQMPNRGAV